MITTYVISLQILPRIPTTSTNYPIEVTINPYTAESTATLNYPVKIDVKPLTVDISTPLKTTAYDFLTQALNTYIDEDRELKTLVNYGEDKQSVIIASRYGPTDSVGIKTAQLKLLQPVPTDISPGKLIFLAREVAQTTIDNVRMRFAPEIDTSPFLRPRNTSVKTNIDLGKQLTNVTLKLLSLQTGSVGAYTASNNVTFDDVIYRKWYSFDFNSSELNLDFTNYENFVFYGSAAMRLQAFREKLKLIESLDGRSKQFEGSVFTGSLATAGAAFIVEESSRLAKEKETIIRSFDRYEQYLYFTPSGSNSPYSASFVYADTGTEYNSIGYWPKLANGTLYSWNSATAQSWYETQLAIAQRYDDFNENNLINTIPTHIREDDNSQSYITFVVMVGHFFDTIKPYIDQFPYIYSRYLSPNEELSKDLVVNIAESVGFQLPTLNSVYSLSDNVIGTTSETPRRDYTVETYKRLLHNLPYFAKSKGTKTALSTLIKTFGITEQLIDVVESGTATTSSYYVFDEFSTGIDFDTGTVQYIKLPVVASNRAPLPKSIQLNCTIADARNQTILTGDNNWALNVALHPTNKSLGRFELTSGSTNSIILTSSYEPIFGDELINVAIRTFDTGSYANLFVCQVEGEDVIFSSSMSEQFGANKFVPLWTSSNNISVGGDGPLVVSRYNGTIDEVRLWGINLSNEMTLNTAFDPGSNAGDAYTDASDYLYVQISNNRIDTGSFPSFMRNESPYKGKDGSPSLELLEIANIGLADFTRYNRTVRQLLPDIGSSAYVTKKIHIAPPANFTPENLDGQGTKQLSRTRSIVSPKTKRIQRGRNKVSISTSPTRIINQNIIRTLGLENINSVLGSPTDIYTNFNKTLDTLKKHYAQYYYVDVNINQYIRILSELNSVLSQVVEYFIPSKATILKGVTIEPNILERVKVPPIKNLRLYGKNTRKTNNAAASLTGSNADYGATFNLSQKINLENDSTVTGSYDTYSQRISTDVAPDLIASSSTYKGSVSGSMQDVTGRYTKYSAVVADTEDSMSGRYVTYIYRHEDWYESRLISESIASGSNKPQRPIVINLTEITTGSFLTFDRQTEDWYTSYLISQSIASGSSRPTRAVAIDMLPDVSSSYSTYDLQHLEWEEFRNISRSYMPGTAEYVSQSFTPWPKQRIDLGFGNMNKIPYNAVNNGSEGAEPYNRVYSRKLFDYEITSERIGGLQSLYVPALYEIPPVADFRDLGTRTFFNSPTGIYYYPITTYTPVYTQPFNQPWNGQQFVGATTWSYGQRYNYNDVVYQEVSDSDENISSVYDNARSGNRKYYVFTTRPSYRNPGDGTAWYSGSVPSYTPPSLDNDNWTRIRFRPTEVREPRRVVFDTFVIPDPALNNYRTTTIDVNKIIDIPDRYVDLFNLGNIPGNSYLTGELRVQNVAALFALQSNNKDLRIRLYRNEISRDADLTRSIETLPSASSGLLLDMQTYEENGIVLVNPIVTLVAGAEPPAGKIYYTINNTTSNTKIDISLLLFYFALEIEPRVPSGYLRKHYKFFRDNSTARKRRNWLGCRFEIIGYTSDGKPVWDTIDGESPVQVILGEGNDIVRNPAQPGGEIITGGGGTLDVT